MIKLKYKTIKGIFHSGYIKDIDKNKEYKVLMWGDPKDGYFTIKRYTDRKRYLVLKTFFQ